MSDVFATFLSLVNETLTAAIVVVAASMLLYNLTRNLRNRVARTSSVVLACVTIVSLCDVFVSLEPSLGTLDATVRVQWIGIAFIPAATFHLSDALLATTGLPSRGRRRRVARLMYLISVVFILTAAFSDILIHPIFVENHLGDIVSGPLFPVYLTFFIVGISVAFINVQRARNRCLTRDTRRRMGYLQVAMLTPALGIFPYSVLLGLSETGSVGMLILVNAANLVLIFMLLFLSYPLSFFGSRLPDRVVKADLLRFMLRGPATGLLALAVINFTTPAERIIGLPGNSFMPFAVVSVVLLWQWFVAIILPSLEKWLIYSGEDDDQLTKLQTLSERLLTRSDLLQLLDAILASSCDYLQVNTAFAASLNESKPELVSAVGPTRPNPKLLEEENNWLHELFKYSSSDTTLEDRQLQKWHSYWIVPLHSKRLITESGERILIGFMGIQARSSEVDLSADELLMFRGFVRRAAETLDDMTLQSEIYGSLEGLLPQITVTRTRAEELEYRPGREQRKADENGIGDREQFIELVRAALRHFWGGPGLTSTRLLELRIVKKAMSENEDNPVRALRSVLRQAIDHQKPEGERKFTSPEWTFYNILVERFVERHKVSEVAIRLAMSEPDLFRKQRFAIEAVANTIIDMERGEAA
ncbi:MAG: histidine kinase N-terminal 7TM domain-containing protein [Chloroflexota bacterium]